MVGRIRDFLEKPSIDLLLRVAILISLIVGIVLAYQQTKLSHEQRKIVNDQQRLIICQVNFNKVSDKNGIVRAQIADEDRKVVDDMVKTVTTAKTGPDIAKALTTYLKAREANDKKRNENPVPQIKDFCG